LYAALVVALVMVLMILPVTAATMVSHGCQVYQGGDLPGMPKYQYDKLYCRDQCNSQADCNYVTWIAALTSRNPTVFGVCWLKSSSGIGLIPLPQDDCDSTTHSQIQGWVPPESWEKQETLPPPCPSVTANINANPTSGPVPLAVTFHDQSADVTQVHWNFGDNIEYDSLGGSNQPHTYTAPGSYTALITVKNACGNTAQETIPITVQQQQPTTGTLTVYTTPSGAMVYVDQIYQGTTPLTIPQLSTNSHAVRLTLTGYTDYDTTVNVYAGQTPLINHQFTQSQPSQTTGSLQVSTIPSGATIILDGKNKGQTPVTISDLSTGDHTAKLTKSGYWDFSQTVHIDAGQTTPLDVSLVLSSQPTFSQTSATPTPYQPVTGGAIVITSNPPGANVYLDGKSSGTTPVTLQNVNPGSHTILLTMQGYSDASRSVDVSAGSQNQISVDMAGGKKTPGFEAALAVFSITGLVLFRMLYRKEE
jgi:PKD repeat protein